MDVCFGYRCMVDIIVNVLEHFRFKKSANPIGRGLDGTAWQSTPKRSKAVSRTRENTKVEKPKVPSFRLKKSANAIGHGLDGTAWQPKHKRSRAAGNTCYNTKVENPNIISVHLKQRSSCSLSEIKTWLIVYHHQNS